VAYHLGVTTHLHIAGTRLILEPRVTTLCTGACFVTLYLEWRKLTLIPAALVVVNQGHPSCGLDFFSDHRAAVGRRIHQFVASIHPLRADVRERQCDPTVVHTAVEAVSRCSLQPFQLIL
jgi:hypothetical protein